MRLVSSRQSVDVLAVYREQLKQVPLLEDGEELRLAERIQKGDPDALDKLILGNLRLVVTIAQDYRGKGLPLEDLIGEGNLGLMRAAEGFDPSLFEEPTAFSTYACYWIKAAIRRALRNQCRFVRLPAYALVLISKWNKACNSLAEKLEVHTPRPDEVVKELEKQGLDISPKKVRLIAHALKVKALTRKYESDDPEEGFSLDENVYGDDTVADTVVLNGDLVEHVLVIIAGLPKRDRTIIGMRHGLDPYPHLNFREAGAALGLTREGVRQAYKTAIAKVATQAFGDQAIAG